VNKIERVRAALAGHPVDRVPASFWYHFPVGQNQGSASVQSHLNYYRAAGLDYLKVMNEHPYQAGVTLKTPADWGHVRPAPPTAPFLQQQLDEVKRIVDAIGGECLVITTIFNPFSSAGYTSEDLVTEHLKADPQSVNQGLGAVAETLAAFAVACLEAGAAGIYYSAQGGEQQRFTEEEFLQYIKPHDLTVLNAIQHLGEFNLVHICKDYIRLPLYADYPGHAFNWAATKHNLSLKEGRDLFGRTIVGGMDDRGVVVNGTPEAIRAAVRAVIADFGTQGLILGADCTFPTDIPVDNIRTAVEATAL